MKAENTLQYMMDFYMDLYPTRQACLNHLFCTIGNGYDWVSGELVSIGDERVDRYTLKEDVERAEPSYLSKTLYKIHMSFEKNGKLAGEEKWYPISQEISYICNYPEDIKPDWLALIEETKELLKKDCISVPENMPYVYG